jgi:hypothetical protein
MLAYYWPDILGLLFVCFIIWFAVVLGMASYVNDVEKETGKPVSDEFSARIFLWPIWLVFVGPVKLVKWIKKEWNDG